MFFIWIKKLFIFGKSPSLPCSFCKNADETMHHLFFECNIIRELWKSLICFFDKCLNLPNLPFVFLGFTNTYCNDILLKNHILLLLKIYVCNSIKHEKISLNNLINLSKRCVCVCVCVCVCGTFLLWNSCCFLLLLIYLFFLCFCMCFCCKFLWLIYNFTFMLFIYKQNKYYQKTQSRNEAPPKCQCRLCRNFLNSVGFILKFLRYWILYVGESSSIFNIFVLFIF